MFWESNSNGIICTLCARRCIIAEGDVGFCRVRKNIKGKLFTAVYGEVSAAYVDPIEKKPLFHFNPGSYVYSIGTSSCNFRCKFCLNFSLSMNVYVPDQDSLTPENIVENAQHRGCQGISYTYNEPTIFFEYAYDTAKLAHKEGLFNTFVTNGYMSVEALEVFAPYLDAVTVDFKGGGDPKFYKAFCEVSNIEPIFEFLGELKKKKIHIEITNLVVPHYGDSVDSFRRLTAWIHDNLGPDVPLHLLRFRPECMMNVPSLHSFQEFDNLRKVAVEEGLYYVYTPYSRNTYCHSCGELLIERNSFEPTSWNITSKLGPHNTCPKCGKKTVILGKCLQSKAKPYPPSARALGYLGYWGFEG